MDLPVYDSEGKVKQVPLGLVILNDSGTAEVLTEPPADYLLPVFIPGLPGSSRRLVFIPADVLRKKAKLVFLGDVEVTIPGNLVRVAGAYKYTIPLDGVLVGEPLLGVPKVEQADGYMVGDIFAKGNNQVVVGMISPAIALATPPKSIFVKVYAVRS